MQDRALQAVYALALAPIAERYADVNSYGFRKLRGTADALAVCFKVFANRYCPVWIWKVDIKGFYDNISQEWLLEHSPMDKELLQQWLDAGYLEKGKWHGSVEKELVTIAKGVFTRRISLNTLDNSKSHISIAMISNLTSYF